MTYEEIFAKLRKNEYITKLPYHSYSENKTGHQLYIDDEYRLTQELKNDLAECYNLKNHPKLDKLWEIAWAFGRVT